jgi:2-C-methyl-D-erythritol 4-phosphate cytidylyltransferase
MKDRSMVIVAAGSSTRFGADKLMSDISGRPLIAHTVVAIKTAVDFCVLVARDDQIPALTALDLGIEIVPGGATRTQSEAAGLAAVPPSRLVGIHDGARPSISRGLIDQLFEAASLHGGAVPGLPPRATLIERDGLTPVTNVVAVQTPQVFWGPELKSAYLAASQSGFTGYDTADVVRNFTNLEVAIIPGDPQNIKVTYPEDLDLVRLTLS